MECDYCGDEVDRTKGKMVVLASGEKLFFCSGKCQKNYGNDRKHGYTSKDL